MLQWFFTDSISLITHIWRSHWRSENVCRDVMEGGLQHLVLLWRRSTNNEALVDLHLLLRCIMKCSSEKGLSTSCSSLLETWSSQDLSGTHSTYCTRSWRSSRHTWSRWELTLHPSEYVFYSIKLCGAAAEIVEWIIGDQVWHNPWLCSAILPWTHNEKLRLPYIKRASSNFFSMIP